MTDNQKQKLQAFMRDGWVAMGTAHQGDVPPEQATYLDLGSGLPPGALLIPGAGWTQQERGLPPPEGGSLARGLMWGGVISIALWAVLLWMLYLLLRWWR